MRDSRRFAAGIVILALGALWFASSAAAEEALSMTPMPSELELAVGTSARGIVVLANTGERRLRQVRIRYVGAGSSLRFHVPNRKQAISSGGAVALRFRVARVREGSGKKVSIRIVATYLVRDAGSRARRRHVSVSTLTVKPLTAVPLLEAKIESKVETINENRSGEAALLLTNPRESSLQIDEVQVRAPDDVDVALSCENGKASLETPETMMRAFSRQEIRDCRGSAQARGRSQEVWPLKFATPDSVAPGHRLVLIRVRGSDPSGNRPGRDPPSSHTVVASTTFDVEVFGESAILRAVGVPVFLLLPGVIVIAVAWFLITQVYPRKKSGGGTEPKLLADIDSNVEKISVAAIAGVAVSLVIALLYPWLTERFPGDERNYLRAYGFRDFYYVFGYSFLIAAAVWLVVVFLFVGRRVIRWLFVLSEGDEPADLVRKIGLTAVVGNGLRRLGLDTALGSSRFPRVAFGQGAQQRRALRLKRRKEGELVTPTISVELTSRASEALARSIEECLAKDRPVRLWLKLRTAKSRKQAVLGFHTSGSIEGPQLKTELRRTGQVGPLAAVAVQQ